MKKIVILSYPLAFDAPVRGVPVVISAPHWDGKTRIVSLPECEKFSKISIRFDVIHERVRRTDRQIPGDSKDRADAYASRGKNKLCRS